MKGGAGQGAGRASEPPRPASEQVCGEGSAAERPPGRAGGAGGRAGRGRRAGRAAAPLPPPARPSAAPFCRRLPRGPEAAAAAARHCGASGADRRDASPASRRQVRAGPPRSTPRAGSAAAPAGGPPGLPARRAHEAGPRGPPRAVTHPPTRGAACAPHAGSRGRVAPAAASGRASRALTAAPAGCPPPPGTAAVDSGCCVALRCAPPQVVRPASPCPGIQGQSEGAGWGMVVRSPVWLPSLFAEATPSNFRCRCSDLATFPAGLHPPPPGLPPPRVPGHPVAATLDREIDIGV